MRLATGPSSASAGPADSMIVAILVFHDTSYDLSELHITSRRTCPGELVLCLPLLTTSS